jgi:hypothetical protein
MEIIYAGTIPSWMKFLYCAKCKELRIKPWYSITPRCLGCIGDATVIQVPNSWMTYVSYVLYIVIPALVVLYVTSSTLTWIYLAVVLLVVMMILQYMDVVRGEKYARSKIRVTAADSGRFKTRGWG